MKEQLADGWDRRLSFSHKPKKLGLCFKEDKKIIIFMRRREHRDVSVLFDTIIHEEIHGLQPDLPEKKTIETTKKIIGELTIDQIDYFFRLYGLTFDQNPALEIGA